MQKGKRNLNCIVCGKPYSCHFNGKPYCNRHYQKMKLYGNPEGKPRKSTNVFSINGKILTITTKNGDVILADAEDYEKLKMYSWCISKTGYAVANTGKQVVKMHRYILGLTNPKEVVDHINNNKLDNRRANIRICTQAENARNRSPKRDYSGIRLTEAGTYNVRITKDRKEIHIGNYKTIEEAVQARKDAEKKYHGEFGYHR